VLAILYDVVRIVEDKATGFVLRTFLSAAEASNLMLVVEGFIYAIVLLYTGSYRVSSVVAWVRKPQEGEFVSVQGESVSVGNLV
jgi:hypothetical protein